MADKIGEYGGWRGLLLYTVTSALLSGAVASGILKWWIDKDLEDRRVQRQWQSASLEHVVAPAVMHLARTNALADRYRETTLFGEAMLLKESNGAMRSLLLTQAHLLPNDLIPVAQCLLTHYDIWLKRFDLTLQSYRASHGDKDPAPDEFFDVGFSALEDTTCGEFPRDAPGEFTTEFSHLRGELYGLGDAQQ